MDDSDQDFSFLCSRLLKRVRRNGGGCGGVKDKEDGDSGSQIQSRSNVQCKRKREEKIRGGAESRCTVSIQTDGLNVGMSEAVVTREGQPKERKVRAKEKVLSRIQQFKRVTPPRLVHTEKEASVESDVQPTETQSLPTPTQGGVEKQESDELLAQKLQQTLEHEAENQAVVNVEDGGLFCQICFKDLSAMSQQLHTVHINRCLDESDKSTSRVPLPSCPPPRPRIQECPICGRRFKSEKTRSTHLKRCSASMGVSPAELLQALQRQAAERENSGDTTDSGKPVRKKARKKSAHMDEDTMVALALSRSLLEQEMKREREWEDERHVRAQLASSTTTIRAGAGKSRVKRRKGVPGDPLPLLLVQDPQAAQNRIQDRVSSLLLIPRPPTPPTPTLLPSALSIHTLLWLKSTLPGGGPASLSEFYTAELGAFIQPWNQAEKVKSLVATQVKEHPSESATAPELHLTQHFPSTPLLGTPGTQALTDLVELAEEGMTLTQCPSSESDPVFTKCPLSGFVPQEAKKALRSHLNPMNTSRLCSDLGSMVNNPQLSDVQLQVDSGEVHYAHSFMLYARCPLLANMIHVAGFGVREEGFPEAQRLLLNDVSGEAVYVLLQYLYTAECQLTETLLPDVLHLARRFGLFELQQQCEQYTGNPEENPGEQEWNSSLDHEPEAECQKSLADTQFLELLHSMWENEDVDGEEFGEAERGTADEDERGGGDGEIKEDLVNEDEINEIYEFAATQRKMGAQAQTSGEEEEEANHSSDAEQKGEGKNDIDMDEVVDIHHSPDVNSNSGSGENGHESRGPAAGLHRSYNRLFSESWGEYKEPSQTPTGDLDEVNTPTSRRTASVSEVIDLSVSPPLESGEPAWSLFPKTVLSSGETPDRSETVCQAGISQSLNAHELSQFPAECSKPPSTSSLCKTQREVIPSLLSRTKPKLFPSPSNHSQPELIVLSDSSDDMELPDDKDPSGDDTPRLPTDSPSHVGLRYSHIKAKEATQVELSPKMAPNPVHPEPSTSDMCNESILDDSAEVSWLIPATPEPSARTSSTQTSSTMRRIQFFPRSHSSSPSSSISDNPKTTSCSDSLKEPSREYFRLSPAFQNLASRSKTSCTESVNEISEPCSSTPLHPDPHLHHVNALGSPLLKHSKLSTPRRAEQADRLGSLHLSQSESLVSPRLRSLSEKESSKSSAESQQCENPGGTEDQNISSEHKMPGETDEVKVMEEGVSCTFDEPPIAFNDSWGLDGNGAIDVQQPCFSLKLDSSGNHTSSPAQSGHGETATFSPFTPCGHGAQGNLQDLEASHNRSLLDEVMWDSWRDEDEDALPLSQKVGSVAVPKGVSLFRTPVACKKTNKAPLVPITPMPSFSDMDTPDLKNRLNRYGVRPLPKKQMVLKLKEIHQYTHQLMSSGSEEETSPRNRPRADSAAFKQPTAPSSVSPRKLQFREEEEDDVLPASQDSSTSSTAESERSNPEMWDSDGDGSDSEGITASQAAVYKKDKLQAVRSFILSDPLLYARVLQYQPLSLCELKAGLQAAGIRLGTAKLLDFLDSQCITVTTAKPGHPAPSGRRARGAGRGRKRLGKVPE